MQQHPYMELEDKAFWKTAVFQPLADRQKFKNLIDYMIPNGQAKIASIGSCFAQHVGGWLSGSGYQFLRSELTESPHSSFATGNIYTPRELIQWLEMSKPNNTSMLEAGVYEDDGAWYDLLRPSVRVNGFPTLEKLSSDRVDCCVEIVQTIREADVFIFTLGLTETWHDKNDLFYPTCPVVISGFFNDAEYQFHNFSYEELYRDMSHLRRELLDLNPDLSILLTVSPVPLTATASGHHVLVANGFSKSTLRSVAGQFSNDHQDVYYFPSFELITTQQYLDPRFEKNMRTVTPAGVQLVMTHFQGVLAPRDNMDSNEISARARTAIEVVCDEEMIAAAQQINPDVSAMSGIASELEPSTCLILVGDSHIGKLSRALNRLGVPHSGGMIMDGSHFANHNFVMCDEEHFVPLQSANSRSLWSKALNAIKECEKTEQTPIVLTNIGLQTHQNIDRFGKWLATRHGSRDQVATAQDMADFLMEDQRNQVQILYSLRKSGAEVWALSDPMFYRCFSEWEHLEAISQLYMSTFKAFMAELEVGFVDLRELFTIEGLDLENYKSEVVFSDGEADWCHGNDQYYDWVASLVSQIGK
jgi:hypothetical protein